MNKECCDITIEKRQDGLIWNAYDVALTAAFDIDITCSFERQVDECVTKNEWKFVKRKQKQNYDKIDDSDILIADTFVQNNIYIIREVCFNSNDFTNFRVRLVINNKSNEEIKLNKLIPLLIKGWQNLKMGQHSAGQWSFCRQGRHKNDLPSVCIIGRKDDSYKDTLSGLTEQGRGMVSIEGELPSILISDQLTVLKGNNGKGPGSLLIGFLTGAEQLVECRLETEEDTDQFYRLEAACMMDGVILEPNQTRVSEWVRLDARADSFSAIEDFVEVKSRVFNARRSLKPPTVYNTWYYYGGTVTYEDIITNLNVIVNKKIPVDVFQIDGGWAVGAGNWEPNKKFPMGMKAVADEIKAAGLIPGIWTGPFIVNQECELELKHPKWLLRKKDGELVTFTTGKRIDHVLDITHPEVLEWIEKLYNKLTYEWGYSYHKLDFTRAAVFQSDVEYYDRSLTRAQAYRNAIQAVRRGAGEDAYILICGGLYDPVVGLINAQRSSADVVSMWDRPKDQKRGKMAPFTIKQNLLRFWMNELWDNDPDSLMVRRRKEKFRELHLSLGLLNDEEVKVTALNQYLGGGIISFTEPMHEIDKDRIGLLRHVIPSMGRAAIPRDMLLGHRFPSIVDMEVVPLAVNLNRWHTVAIINWTDCPETISIKLNEDLVGKYIDKSEKYSISEFWSGSILRDIGYNDDINLGEILPHSAKLLRISMENEEAPALLYANGHFSMGGREIFDWNYSQDRLDIGIDWKWDYPVEIIIQAPYGKKWVDENVYCHVNKSRPEIVKLKFDKRYHGVFSIKLLSDKI